MFVYTIKDIVGCIIVSIILLPLILIGLIIAVGMFVDWIQAILSRIKNFFQPNPPVNDKEN